MEYPMHTYTDASGEILGRAIPDRGGFRPVVYVKRRGSVQRNRPIIMYRMENLQMVKDHVEYCALMLPGN